MNRDDVIDVLSVVAAATRRPVGETDADVWQAVIGGDDKQLALRAVRDHLAERPGVWMEPGHVHQRVRAIVRDRLEREPDAMREARQAQIDARVAEHVAAIAESKEMPAPVKFIRKSVTGVNPLTVKCPWCNAGFGTRCTIPGTQIQLEEHPPMRTGFHPSRIEAAEATRHAVSGTT